MLDIVIKAMFLNLIHCFILTFSQWHYFKCKQVRMKEIPGFWRFNQERVGVFAKLLHNTYKRKLIKAHFLMVTEHVAV